MKRTLFFGLIFLGSLVALNFASASLYDFWQERGEPFVPCNQERKVLAAEMAMWNYDCSAEQNNELERRLRDFYKTPENGVLGFSVVSGYRTTLSLPMTAVQTTVPVSSLLTKDSHTLTMGDLGDYVFLTIEPGGTKEEIVKCTGITGSTFSGCTRGLAFYATSTAAVAANQKTHNASSQVVMSNVHYVYEQYVDTTDKDQTIAGDKTASGIWTFDNYPFVTSTLALPTSTYQLITKQYADSLANQGAATSTESIAGISEQATQIEMASTTQFDAYNPHFVSSEYTTSTPKVRGLYGVVTENDGYISKDFIRKTDTYTGTNAMTGQWAFNATTTFATTTMASSTINNLNVIGNTTMVGNATTTGSQSVGVLCFDGVNCGTDMTSLMETVTTTEVGYYATSTAGSASNGTWTYVQTTGFRPKIIKLTYFIQGHTTSGGLFNKSQGTAIFMGTNLIGGLSYKCDTDANSNQCHLVTDEDKGTVGTSPDLDEGSGSGGERIVISISATSATGFTIQHVQTGDDSSAATYFRTVWEAYR